MTKHLIYIYICLLSTLCASDMVKVTLRSGHTGQGEWIGTYSGHVHLLIEDNVYHYDCNDILSVMIDDKANIKEAFVFDCSENSVSSDILFPPEINPMTGEWTQNIPDIFNPNIPKLVKEVKKEVVEVDSSVNSPTITEKPAKIKETTFWVNNEEKPSDSQETAKKEDITEDDFIMINGVKYVRASLNQDTDQNDFFQGQKKDFTISKRKIRSLARRNATLNHDKFKWGVAGAGSCITGMFGAGVGAAVAGFPGFLLGGTGGLLLPYSTANNFNPNLNYPPEVKGLDEKRLYKDTYLKQARILAKESVRNGPLNLLAVGGAFFFFIAMVEGF